MIVDQNIAHVLVKLKAHAFTIEYWSGLDVIIRLLCLIMTFTCATVPVFLKQRDIASENVTSIVPMIVARSKNRLFVFSVASDPAGQFDYRFSVGQLPAWAQKQVCAFSCCTYLRDVLLPMKPSNLIKYIILRVLKWWGLSLSL